MQDGQDNDFYSKQFQVSAPRRHWARMLCALVLLWAQAFQVVHAIEHLAGPAVDACEVCLLSSELDNPIAGSAAFDFSLGPVFAEQAADTPDPLAERHISFRQRAPPVPSLTL